MNKKEIKTCLQTYMKKLRKIACKNSKNKTKNTSEIIKTEIRKGYLNGKIVNRLVIFLKGTGCTNTKKTGGCTYCGFIMQQILILKFPSKII